MNKGDMGMDGGRLRITSLNAMLEMVAPDEPNDAASVLANIDRLCERWARKNPEGKAETARTYASRAKTTIEAYFTWSAAPEKYDPRKVISKKAEPGTAPKKRTPARAPIAAAPEPMTPPAAPPANTQRAETRNFPLGDGRGAITFELPPDGVLFTDVKKFALHLLTLAKDFDVTDADQAQMFALVVRGNRN